MCTMAARRGNLASAQYIAVSRHAQAATMAAKVRKMKLDRRRPLDGNLDHLHRRRAGAEASAAAARRVDVDRFVARLDGQREPVASRLRDRLRRQHRVPRSTAAGSAAAAIPSPAVNVAKSTVTSNMIGTKACHREQRRYHADRDRVIDRAHPPLEEESRRRAEDSGDRTIPPSGDFRSPSNPSMPCTGYGV